MVKSLAVKNRRRANPGRIAFQTVNITLLIFLAALCLLPFIHVLTVSLSNNAYIDAGEVGNAFDFSAASCPVRAGVEFVQ